MAFAASRWRRMCAQRKRWTACWPRPKPRAAVVTKPGEDSPHFTGRTGYFADPDGHLWEVAWNPAFKLAEDGSLTLPPAAREQPAAPAWRCAPHYLYQAGTLIPAWRAHAERQRHPSAIPGLFRGRAGTRRRPRAPLVPQDDPTLAVRQCRHGAVQELFHRRGEAAVPARGDEPEMRPRRRQAQRPRQCRLHRAPPHVLRDARQFFVRRLFQGRRDRRRLDADH